MTTQKSSLAAPERQSQDSKRAMWSGFLGSAVEFYDFLLYTTAATLVFPQLFFTNLSPEMGVSLSFVTLAAGYLARPLGGIIFGHFGDRLGRRAMLMITLVMMGGVSALIGLLPTYNTIGMAAPVLLVVLRIVQGIAMGGEWAGAALLSMEHAGEKRRGFGASVAVAGPLRVATRRAVHGVGLACPVPPIRGSGGHRHLSAA
jgi:MFS family permease